MKYNEKNIIKKNFEEEQMKQKRPSQDVGWVFSPEWKNPLRWWILFVGLILTGIWLGGDGGCPIIFDPKVARGVQVAQNVEIIESLGYENGAAVYLIRFNDELKMEAVLPQEGECLPLIGQF
jgi:hypothetical protein